MFRRLAPRLCAKGTPPASSAGAAATTAAAATKVSTSSVRKPRSFDATHMDHAATEEIETPINAKNATPSFAASGVPEADAAAFASSSSTMAGSGLQADADPQLSAAAKRKIKVVEEIGDEAFEENTRVLRNIALRGMRSGLIVIVGAVTFIISLKRKKRRDEAFDEEERKKREAEESMDPTERYLSEMSGLGFDTEQGEIDAAEARKKALAAQAAAAAKK